jgi:hypothetical protein
MEEKIHVYQAKQQYGGYRHPAFMCQLGYMKYTGKLYKMKDYDIRH